MSVNDAHNDPVPFIVASTNPAKRRTLQQVVGQAGCAISPPHDLSRTLARALADSEEGATVADIARAKALVWSRALPGTFVVATDGGLVVPGLGSRWEPTRTRRFAGDAASDAARARALLALASGLEGDQRRISWREALVLARDGHIVGEWIAESSGGVLATSVDPALIEAGGGFWVPAIWLCSNADDAPLAALPESERFRCQDHWIKLGADLRAALQTLAGQ